LFWRGDQVHRTSCEAFLVSGLRVDLRSQFVPCVEMLVSGPAVVICCQVPSARMAASPISSRAKIFALWPFGTPEARQCHAKQYDRSLQTPCAVDWTNGPFPCAV
jgi:hypothetical protein